MRNPTMAERMDAALGVLKKKTASAPEARKGAGVRPKTGVEKLREAARDLANARNDQTLGAPYVTSLKRRDPFSVHAYSFVPIDIVTEMKLAEPEKPLVSESASRQVSELANELTPETCDLIPENRDQISGTQEPRSQANEKIEDGDQKAEPEPETPRVEAAEPEPTPLVPPTASPEKPTEPIEPVAPAIYIPPDLVWLEEETPFIEPLKFMVSQVRGAKANVNFTLGQSIERQKQLHVERDVIDVRLGQEERTEAEQRETLRKLDDMISACALMAEQSMTVDQELLTPHTEKKSRKAAETKSGNGAKPAPRAYRRWDLSNNAMCHKEDIVRFFHANPNTNWRAPEIRKLLPPAKQAHAKGYLNVLLNNLYKEGLLLHPDEGIYRYVPSE